MFASIINKDKIFKMFILLRIKYFMNKYFLCFWVKNFNNYYFYEIMLFLSERICFLLVIWCLKLYLSIIYFNELFLFKLLRIMFFMLYIYKMCKRSIFNGYCKKISSKIMGEEVYLWYIVFSFIIFVRSFLKFFVVLIIKIVVDIWILVFRVLICFRNNE